MEIVVLGLGLFWVFSSCKINTTTTCLRCSLLGLKGELDTHQGITSPSEHFRVSPYLHTGFRLGLCAWLHCALLLQRRKGKKCHSKQKLLQLQGEAKVLVPTAGAEFLQSFPKWSQLVFIPQFWCWVGCTSETKGENRSLSHHSSPPKTQRAAV